LTACMRERRESDGESKEERGGREQCVRVCVRERGGGERVCVRHRERIAMCVAWSITTQRTLATTLKLHNDGLVDVLCEIKRLALWGVGSRGEER
jgi:hypothetical protein